MHNVEYASADELAELLALVLAEPGSGRRADRARVRAFIDYIEDARLSCDGSLLRRDGQISAALVMIRLPGGTAIVMPAAPGELGNDARDQVVLLSAGLARLREVPLYYSQALIEPQAEAKGVLLRAAGFERLTTLHYLERDARYPWVEPPPPSAARWLCYAPENHNLFTETVAATYHGSRDCPEIAGIRPIDDVLAGHRAAGCFHEALWELALIDDAPAGCLLLSRVGTELLEVVYMGVAPAFRGRRIGWMLLQRAAAQARAQHRARLTLVVDVRNDPARRLYARFGLNRVATRDVYLWRGQRC
jgi:mycothiol synthase